MASETYVCPTCGAEMERPYSVPYFLKACDTGCGFGKIIQKKLLALIRKVPEEARPETWASMDVGEQLHIARQEGIVTKADFY